MSIDLKNVGSGFKRSALNENFQDVENELNDNVLRRDGLGVGEDNSMTVDLDMGGNQIKNTSGGTESGDLVTYDQLTDGTIHAGDSDLLEGNDSAYHLAGANVTGSVPNADDSILLDGQPASFYDASGKLPKDGSEAMTGSLTLEQHMFLENSNAIWGRNFADTQNLNLLAVNTSDITNIGSSFGAGSIVNIGTGDFKVLDDVFGTQFQVLNNGNATIFGTLNVGAVTMSGADSGGQKITNGADGTAGKDYVTKDQLDAISAGGVLPASNSVRGSTFLSDAIDSSLEMTSGETAATPLAVKTAYDLADAALPSSSAGTAALVDTGVLDGDVPLNSDLGTAAYLNFGTGTGNLPRNADLGSASLVNTGTGASDVPLNANLGDLSTLDSISSSEIDAGAVGDSELAAGNKTAVAWVRINLAGSTLSVGDSFNVISVVDDNVGRFTVNFSPSRSSSDYVAVAAGEHASGGSISIGVQDHSTVLCRLESRASSTGAYTDPESASLLIFEA